MAKSKVVRVEAFQCAGTMAINIQREYSNGLKTDRVYTRPRFRTGPLSLPRCIHLAVLKGTARIRPWLSRELGWSAKATSSS